MKVLSVSVLMIVGLVFVGAASAGIPDASTSTIVAVGQGVPPCNPGATVICPASDYGWVEITVTVRNIYGDVLPGKTVTCYANVVSGGPFCWCPGEDPQVGVTDINGEVVFIYSDFGGCGELEWYADCESVIIGPSNTIFIASFDIGNDCWVELVDFGQFALAYLVDPADPCFDYNCDGQVELIDFGEFALHYLHLCP
jgi:hypothetical protein